MLLMSRALAKTASPAVCLNIKLSSISCAEFVVVGQMQQSVGFVRPVEREFERPACIEARCAWVAASCLFGFGTGLVDARPLRQQERKVIHRSPRKARCWREATRPSSVTNYRVRPV